MGAVLGSLAIAASLTAVMGMRFLATGGGVPGVCEGDSRTVKNKKNITQAGVCEGASRTVSEHTGVPNVHVLDS